MSTTPPVSSYPVKLRGISADFSEINEQIEAQDIGRVRDVATGPDGAL